MSEPNPIVAIAWRCGDCYIEYDGDRYEIDTPSHGVYRFRRKDSHIWNSFEGDAYRLIRHAFEATGDDA